MIGFSSLAFTEENKDDMTDMISKNMKQVEQHVSRERRRDSAIFAI